MRHNLLRRVVVALGTGALAVPFAAGAAHAAPGSRASIPESAPAWATPANQAATPSDNQKISFQVNLALRDPQGAEKLAAEVSNPRGASYGRYLTPNQFNQRFAATDAQVRQVEGYLRGRGLSVGRVATGNRWIEAAGTVSQVDSAFGTRLKTYQYKGKRLRAPEHGLTVPAQIAGLVGGVSGLTQSPSTARPAARREQDQLVTPKMGSKASTPPPVSTCSHFWGEHYQTLPAAYGRTQFPTAGCGATPDQYQTAYGIKGALAQGQDGSGTRIAIVDAYGSPTMKADTNTFSTASGLPTFAGGQYSEKLFKPYDKQTECGGEDAWNGEEAIDVEAAHGMAPGAGIVYVGAKNCAEGLDDALNWVVQTHAADFVSNSWANHGEDEDVATLKRQHSIFVQAATEGIGMYFASGDWGDELVAGNTPTPQPDYPASDPYVTGVGGTTFAFGAGGGYQWETGWGNNLDQVDYTRNPAGYQDPLPGHFYGGAGGGTSALFDQPAYQAGVVPDSLARKHGGDRARVVPDVAAEADPETGYLVGRTIGGKYTVQTWGGTSLACPLFVGVQAVASTGRVLPLGFVNPLLYALAGSSAYHDVAPQPVPQVVASVKATWAMTQDRDTSLATAVGYDDVTGVGSPNGKSFLRAESVPNLAGLR